MDLAANVRERILQPLHEVFTAVIEPRHMSRYFISHGSGPLTAGTTVWWEFADVGARIAVDVLEVEPDRKVVYESEGCGTRSRVTIGFAADGPGATVVTIHEGCWPLDQEGAERAMGQAAGWTYFLCCLKAWLQFGINLRQGLDRRLNDVEQPPRPGPAR
jgi:uncharacterized protein YndB with AHSA1/START domain